MMAALTIGGNVGSCGIGEVESSEEGTVLHLQALYGHVGRGAVDEPMEWRRAQERGRGGIVLVVADLTVEVADSHPSH